MIQKPMFSPQTEWLPPESFPDLSKHDEIAIDLETKDPGLKTMGSGSVTGKGRIVGVALAVDNWSGYYPIAISSCLDKSGKDSGGSHSVCGLNIGFCIMSSLSPISFLNNVLLFLCLVLYLLQSACKYIL